ncbi:MAG: phosphonate monoester hydrolase, partial [Pseudomonadota bacterium]
PMLFDMANDPDELIDIAEDPDSAGVIDMMYDRLLQWALRQPQRTTLSEADVRSMRGKSQRRGITLGIYDETEIDPELTAAYRGPAPRRPA